MTRDTWQGDENNPQSLNHWNYTDGNPIIRTDPSGKCYVVVDGDGVWYPDNSSQCTHQKYVNDYYKNHQLSSIFQTSDSSSNCNCNKVWDLPVWETDPGLSWTQWRAAFMAFGIFCKTKQGSNDNVTWYTHFGDISQEELIAIMIVKEVDSLLDVPNSIPYFSEAIGREYWHNCGPSGCQIVNGIPDSRLISFFEYSQSWRAIGTGGIKDILYGGRISSGHLSTARKIAKDVLSGGPGSSWKSGKVDTRPYDYGYVEKSKAPPWLITFLDDAQNQGFEWNEYVYSFNYDGSDVFDYVMTPQQKRNVCFNDSCFNLPFDHRPPDFITNEKKNGGG